MNIDAFLKKFSDTQPLRVKPSTQARSDGEDDSSESSRGFGKGALDVSDDGNTVLGARRRNSDSSDGSASSSSSDAPRKKRTARAPVQEQAPAPRQPARTLGTDEASEDGVDEIQWSKMRPEPDWVTTPQTQVFRRLVGGSPQPPERCVGCRYSRGDSYAIQYEHWHRLNNMITGKCRRMDRLQMMVEIKEFFDKFIRNPTLPPNPIPDGCTPIPEWDLPTIVAHFEYHDAHPVLRCIKRAEQLAVLRDLIFEENLCYNPRTRTGRFMIDGHGNRRVRVNNESLRNYLALCAAEEKNDKLLGRDRGGGGGDEDIAPFLPYNGRKFVIENVAGFDCTAPDAQMGGAAQGGTVSGQGGKRRRVLS